MEKTVIIDGKEVKLKASALVPRIYRAKFGRDMVADMKALQNNYKTALKDKTDLSIVDLTLFENLAWTFAKHADAEAIPDTPDEWLATIEGVFSIYEIMPIILELWGLNQATTSTPAKK